MGNWEKNLENARMNILRISDACGECLYTIAMHANVEPDKLRQFVVGADSLSFGELQRVCASLDFPIWAIHVPDVSIDTDVHEPETIELGEKIMALQGHHCDAA